MPNIFEQYDSIEQLGSEIVIPDSFPAIFVSENNEVYCYIGIFLDEERNSEMLYMNPYYMQGKHSTDKKIMKEIRGFFQITNGYIVLDNFVDNQYSNKKYKNTNTFIRYPIAADTYYGVWKEYNDEDEALTKAVFGLTYNELYEVLDGYAEILGTKNMYGQYPRLTRSIRAVNFCDITGGLIPSQFPYITFAQSGYDFSHVSLWGFYRHLQLLMEKSISSRLGKALLEVGVPEKTLNALLCIDDFLSIRLSKVFRNTLYKY